MPIGFDTPESRIEQLHAALQDGEGPVLLLTHDYPDPDCLACAMGLHRLLDFWEMESDIGHGGGIGRPENKAMVGVLDIPTKPFDSLRYVEYRGAVLIDTQPEAGNNSLPASLPTRGVIDHHPARAENLENIPFVDIRTEYGATSTMVLEYIEAAGVEIDDKLATAFFLGIQTDTDNLLRDAGETDVAAYTRLLPQVDLSAVQKVMHPPMPDEYFAMLHDALENASRYGEAAVVSLPCVPQPDMLSMISDILVTAKGVAWALAVGACDGNVYLSLRLRPPRKNAASIMRKTVGESGRGGGHALAAGGMIPLQDGDTEGERKAAMERFLLAVGMNGVASRRFCMDETESRPKRDSQRKGDRS